ncbi:MAG: hypothetical protein IPG97_15525 [Microthrixaceae bacterium]|nr:hypothetical protein [Microthrixaceae bacterium]
MVVVGVITVAVAGWWCATVLGNEDRYLRAVAPLSASPRFARLAGYSVSVAVRHRAGWRRPLSRPVGRVLASATRRSMGTRSFDRMWLVGHRTLHRHRVQHRQLARFRVAAAMVGLATLGLAVGVSTKLDPRS